MTQPRPKLDRGSAATTQETRLGALKFHGRHATTNPALEAFQFFKNEKFLVWFRTPKDAEAMAKVLTTGHILSLPAVPVQPLS